MTKEIMDKAAERMASAEQQLLSNFASVRTGGASAMILDRVKADYYGVPTPINQMAAIKTPDAHTLVIEPWDKSALGGIDHAIQEANLGVMPNNDGSVIRLSFPPLTEERRKEFVKECRTYVRKAVWLCAMLAAATPILPLRKLQRTTVFPKTSSVVPRLKSRSLPMPLSLSLMLILPKKKKS